MEVRHNTSLLEQAVHHVLAKASLPTRQAEAEVAAGLAAAEAVKAGAWRDAESAVARERAAAEAALADTHSRAVARRRLATGAAVALAATGLGLGLFLGLWDDATLPGAPELAAADPVPPAAEPAAPEPPRPRPSPLRRPPPPEAAAAEAPAEPGAVTVDFTKFASTTFTLRGREWDLQAGHYYASDADPSWRQAWCYTTADEGGVEIRVQLARRESPDGAPTGLLASSETLARAGLDDAAALALAAACPWLDGRTFAPSDFAAPPGRAAPRRSAA